MLKYLQTMKVSICATCTNPQIISKLEEYCSQIKSVQVSKPYCNSLCNSSGSIIVYDRKGIVIEKYTKEQFNLPTFPIPITNVIDENINLD